MHSSWFLTKLQLQLKQLMEYNGKKQMLTNILAFKKKKFKNMSYLNKNRTEQSRPGKNSFEII